jgi:uncharacterized protein YdaU (DUF1376 family)
MAKDPAFLLYSQDFLIGCAEMTNEEIGQYFRILCYMHQKGRMPEKTIRLLVGSVSDTVRLKFKIDENGNWFNERLEEVIQERQKFVESRRINGSKGGRPKKTNKPTVNHMEDENENEIVNDINVLKEEFEKFRKVYPGTKRGLDTEFKILQKHKDWREIIPILLPSLERQHEVRQFKKDRGEFVPNWKNLQTYLNQRSWEENKEVFIEADSNQLKLAKIIDSYGE